MKTNITTLETDVIRIWKEVEDTYNVHRDAKDRLCIAERKLAVARKNGD